MELKLKAGQFYGTTARSISARGFRFTEKAYSSRATLPTHAHELSHFCFVLAGNYNEKIGSKLFERKPATLVYYPPDVSHGEEHFSNGRHFLVEIDFRELDRVREYGARLTEPVVVGYDSSLWLAARMYREFSYRDALSELVLESVATELLVTASRQFERAGEKKRPAWLDAVKEFLRENFSEPPGLNDLANEIGVHPTHLARVFRQFERCTVGDYVRDVRINYARQRMLNSSEPLVQIALAAGFADQTHFSRSFKRATGLTPGEFRRMFAAS